MSDTNGEVSIELAANLDSLKVFGKMVKGERSMRVDTINLKLIENLKNIFIGLSDWVIEFKSHIENKEYLTAYNLLAANKGNISFLKMEILEDLLRLDKSALSKVQRKDFVLLIIAVANKESKFGWIEPIVDDFISEFGVDLAPDLKQSLILTKANGCAQNGKLNTANNYYKKVIESAETAPIDKAFAYRGLAIISIYPEEKITYQKLSVDKFLEAGKRDEAIKDLVFIAKLYENKNAIQSLNEIDTAISLYDTEKILDKEYSASLFHRKATYLFSLNKFEEALKSAEIACSLRENLFGNEHEQYSSYSLAKILCEKLKMDDKIIYYSNKIEVVLPVITSDEFALQLKIKKCLDEQQKIELELLREVESCQYPHLKFSAYLFNALLNSVSFEEKIDWLDKARLLLNDKDFHNYEYSVLYFNLGEAYRVNNNIDEAIKNYDTCLLYNQFFYQAIQNSGAILWQAKQWEKSKVFFEKQIENVGESPVLCYALGRSYFELGTYKEAFNYFRKANGKIDGLDISSYVLQCIEKDANLELESLKSGSTPSESPISLESFKQTLQEFSKTISSNSRMYFWENDLGSYKWTSKPEEKGKQLLITALTMKYGQKPVEIIQERPAGAGIIDLYIILRGGLKIVVELKICGANYSSSYAMSGEDQLIHYLKTTETNVGFLVVFDGRRRDFGKGFKPVQLIESLTIFTTAIDMKPEIEKGRSLSA